MMTHSWRSSIALWLLKPDPALLSIMFKLSAGAGAPLAIRQGRRGLDEEMSSCS